MKSLVFFIGLLSVSYKSSAAEMPSGVYNSLAQFNFENTSLPKDYVKIIPQFIYDLLVKSETEFTQSRPSCTSLTDIQYINQLNKTNDPVIKELESSFIRIEVAKCFENTTPEKVLSTLSSPEFRKKSFSTLTSVTITSENSLCETSKAPLLGRSHYCYKNYWNRNNLGYLQLFTINDWFELSDQYTVPVYFRASFMTARQINNTVLLHSVSYVRGPKLSFFQKLTAKSYIENNQIEIFQKLDEEIRN